MTNLMRLLFPVLLFSWAADGRTEVEICGSHPYRVQEAILVHQQNRQRLLALRGVSSRLPGITTTASRDAGDVFILEDDGGVIARRNLFGLDRKRLSFAPADSIYRYMLSDGGYDAAAASSGSALALDDDDSRLAPLPFSFPFFGKQYREVYINSDGNLTFGEPDSASSDRSLGRMTAGPPRIAGLFSDLDPSAAPASGGIRVLAESDRFVVSWVSVPEYSNFGGGSRQTFQIALSSTGRIEFAWNGSPVSAAVVGIAPGRIAGSAAIVSFSTPSASPYSGAIAERFGTNQEIDTVSAAQRFFETHDDAYDYIVFFNNQNVTASAGAIAFFVPVRNNRTGFGDSLTDTGVLYGSPRRLLGVMNMGQLTQYPADPNRSVPGRAITGDTPLTILGHEAGHMFLSYVSVTEPGAAPNSAEAQPMLGRQLFHWNFKFNSEASLLEGNRIRDNGAGTSPRFTTVATVEGYSPLDQYLMGFRPSEDVAPTFYVKDATVSAGRVDPQVGVSFNGTRRDVSVDEIISIAGRRTPDHTVAQRRYRFAFVLITGHGAEPTTAELAQVERYRAEFEPAYRKFSGERAWADASIRRSLRLSVAPAAGVIADSTVEAVIELGRPAAAAVAVSLSAPMGVAAAPGSVVIPAGASRATFTLRGMRTGVEELSAEPSDRAYETAYARVQVRAASATLIAVSAGGRQTIPLSEPVEFRVKDENDIPYPGVTVRAAVTSGSLAADSAVTDPDGRVRFAWTAGEGPVNELTASVEGGPSAKAVALGEPFATADSIVNAATFKPGLAPGAIASIFGASLGFAQVSIGERTVRILYNDDRQINFVVPLDLLAGAYNLRVTTAAGTSGPLRTAVEITSPGIFAVRDAGSGLFEIYATGLGVLLGTETAIRPQVSVDSAPVEVLFSGLAPGFVGLYQVNIRAAGLGAGNHVVAITAGGRTSNAVQF